MEVCVCVGVYVCETLKPQKTVKLERVPGAVLTHARSYLKVLSGIPEGSIDSNRSGIPEGSIDSIGNPLGLDRSIDRSIDRLESIDRSIDRLESIDRGAPRARSTRSGIP